MSSRPFCRGRDGTAARNCAARQTSIADGCTIGPNSYLENVKVGENTRVNASQVYDSEIGSDTTVGPFAYVRPGSRIGSHVRCGDFVEVKNSTIGDGTKISHLTYIGDSDVGRDINFGCGTVTVNYDRVKNPARLSTTTPSSAATRISSHPFTSEKARILPPGPP